eukprot:3178106-Ditylum_brightwellii.AAC.1
MRERQLVRPTTTSSSTVPTPQASANVVGLLPQDIYHTLNNNKGTTSPTGIVDSTHSSLSLLIQPNGTIYVWPHIIQTLSEDLLPVSNTHVVKLVHPEYNDDYVDSGGGGGALKANLVTLAPYGSSTSSSSSSSKQERHGGGRTTTPHSLYA